MYILWPSSAAALEREEGFLSPPLGVLATSSRSVILSLAELLPIALTVKAAISNSVDLVFRMVVPASVNQGKKTPQV
jgi:hypothetical protein